MEGFCLWEKCDGNGRRVVDWFLEQQRRRWACMNCVCLFLMESIAYHHFIQKSNNDISH